MARRKTRLRGHALNYNAAAQARYYANLRKLVLFMSETVNGDVEKLFHTPTAKSYFGEDGVMSDAARVLTDALAQKFNALFGLNAKSFAEQMAVDADKSSGVALRSSLKELSGGLTLSTNVLKSGVMNDILNATITENVALIKSIGTQYLSGVQQAVMRSITTGNGLQDLVPFLKQHEGVTLRRARNIALDQTRKAYNNLNKHRMQAIGVEQFEWMHSGGGQHPRKLHIAMNGKTFSFEDLPVIDERTGERGIPGQAINCRCRMRPVIRFDEGDDNAN